MLNQLINLNSYLFIFLRSSNALFSQIRARIPNIINKIKLAAFHVVNYFCLLKKFGINLIKIVKCVLYWY